MSTREERESEFWDHELRSLQSYIDEYRSPMRNVVATLDALEPLEGKRVLDFACGAGVLSAHMAARGASVVGVDIAPATIDRARELAAALGVTVDFRCVDITKGGVDLGTFDRIAGQYALHHVDIEVFAPILARYLDASGHGAFLETMFTNPALRVARRVFPGRFGCKRFGNDDEHPIDARALSALRRAFGSVELGLAEMWFLRLADRQYFDYKHPTLTRALGAVDDALGAVHALHGLSYYRVIVVRP
jgi:SAM-dependent methyltransferase